MVVDLFFTLAVVVVERILGETALPEPYSLLVCVCVCVLACLSGLHSEHVYNSLKLTTIPVRRCCANFHPFNRVD